MQNTLTKNLPEGVTNNLSILLQQSNFLFFFNIESNKFRFFLPPIQLTNTSNAFGVKSKLPCIYKGQKRLQTCASQSKKLEILLEVLRVIPRVGLLQLEPWWHHIPLNHTHKKMALLALQITESTMLQSLHRKMDQDLQQEDSSRQVF